MASSIASNATASTGSGRIVSLDQFRGYTVLGMFLVNFVGSFEAINVALPLLKHHHTYCSYADTIMPHFLFAVGFAYRMTFLHRWQTSGLRSAYWRAWKRGLALLLLGFVIHHLDGHYRTWAELQDAGLRGVLGSAFQRNYFQTLTHIGLASLWVMPVIGARSSWRILFAVLSAVLFHVVSELGYYEWVMKRPGIDGGPLGFLTWTIPLMLGTLAYDLISVNRFPIRQLLLAGTAVMLLGYALSCLSAVTGPDASSVASRPTGFLVEPPFVPPSQPVSIWTMSQRAGSVSYVTFGAGFSMVVYALFVLACDLKSLQLGFLRTLGANALAGYVVHILVNGAVKPFVPKDSPLAFVFCGFAVSLGICYVVLRQMERNKVYWRL